jgi:NADPH-dependent ferric siderophore reductase
MAADPVRIRREPPRFLRAAVHSVEPVTRWLVHIVFGGPELGDLVVDQPAASVRLLLPSPGAPLELPTWRGNEFLLTDDRRPTIRTLTPELTAAGETQLGVHVVLHGAGAASQWAITAAVGDEIAVSGPGRGFTVDATVGAYLLAGDETAVPAIRQLLAALPASVSVHVLVEVTHPDARLPLPGGDRMTVEWLDAQADRPPGDALVDAVRSTAIAAGTHVWAAGEAAAMQRIRRHLFDERGMARAQTTVRGYWKVGRAATDDE